MMSLRQFAKLAGTSAATASRAFTDSKDLSEKTRQRILAVAEQVNFRPSAVANAAFGGKTRSVGVVIPGLHVSYFVDIAASIQQHLMEKNYLPILLDSSLSPLPHCLKRLKDHRIDALIVSLVNEQLSTSIFSDLLELHIPIITVGPSQAGLSGDSVDTDDITGGRLAAEHLLALGHQNVACTYYGEGHSSCDNRIHGFSFKLAQAGLDFIPKQLIKQAPLQEGGWTDFQLNIKKCLTEPNRPTAIFATNDFHAAQVYHCARELALRIPEDLSVVGFADLALSDQMSPPLTTIRQNGNQVGKEATELAFQQLATPPAATEKRIVPVALKVRQSTTKPPHP